MGEIVRILRHLWLVMALLGLGLGPLMSQALKQTACCCTSQVPTAVCHCQEQPDSHCGLECAPEFPQAVFVAPVDPPQDRVAALVVLTEILVLLQAYQEPSDGRLSLASGWILPTSPPLLASLLNLPPPLCC